MKTTVLVIGITGQLGSEVFKLMSQKECNVYGTSRQGGEKNTLQLNLQSGKNIVDTINSIRPHIIINCAAYTAVDKAEEERDSCEQINSHAPKIIAQAAKAIDALLIHISTDYVFSGNGDHFQKETEPAQPINHYGACKFNGEEHIIGIDGKYVILRTSWVYSSRGNNFAKTMMKLAKSKEELSIVSDQIGAPTSVLEISKAISVIVEYYLSSPQSFSASGVYHLSCEGQTSWAHFAEKIFQFARMAGVQLSIKNINKIKTSQYKTLAKRPLNSRLDNGKFTKTFGVSLCHWEIACKKVIDELIHLDKN